MILESVWTRDMFTCHTESTEQRHEWEGRNGFRDGYSFISSTRYNSSKEEKEGSSRFIALPLHTTWNYFISFSHGSLSQNVLSCFLVSCLSFSFQLESHQRRTSSVQTNPYDSTCSCSEMISSGEQAQEEKEGKREIDTKSSFVSSFMSLVLRLFSLFFLSMALATSSPFFQLTRLTVLYTLSQDIYSKRVRYYKGNNITTTILVDWVWASV